MPSLSLRERLKSNFQFHHNALKKRLARLEEKYPLLKSVPARIAYVYTAFWVIISIVILASVFALSNVADSFARIEALGSYLGGVANTIVIVWVIAALFAQLSELTIQRKELIQQREAIQRTAQASREQNLLMFSDHITRTLSVVARSILQMISDDPDYLTSATPVAVLDAELASGNSNVFFNVIVENDVVRNLITRRCAMPVGFTKNYVGRYISLFEGSRRIFGHFSDGPIVYDALFTDQPISECYEALRTSIPMKD